MGCCLIMLALAGLPRIASIFWWLVDPFRFVELFPNWIVPVLGILFLPWTTLAYVFIGDSPGLFEWFILGFAFIIDISTYGGGGAARRRRND